MTSNEALAIAYSYVLQQNQEAPFHPDYKYVVDSFKEYTDCWYFDYCVINQSGLPEEEWELFAGAPGFTISKDSKIITVISLHELQQLTQLEALLQQATAVADALLNNSLRLQDLRQYFKGSLAELLLLKKSLESHDLSDYQKKNLLVSRFLTEANS